MYLLPCAPILMILNSFEVTLIFVEEVLEKVIYEYLALNVVWQFTHESDVSFILDGAKWIIHPIVIEKIFNFRDEFLV